MFFRGGGLYFYITFFSFVKLKNVFNLTKFVIPYQKTWIQVFVPFIREGRLPGL